MQSSWSQYPSAADLWLPNAAQHHTLPPQRGLGAWLVVTRPRQSQATLPALIPPEHWTAIYQWLYPATETAPRSPPAGTPKP
jgi:hypothetical protein